MNYILAKTILAGFLLSMPIGPVNLLCIRNSLDKGQKAGLATGMGAALADGLCALLATIGLTLVTDYIVREKETLSVIGGLFLLFIGTRMFFSMREYQLKKQNSAGLSSFMLAFLITLTNPASLLSLIAVLAGFGLAGFNSGLSGCTIASLGIFLGASMWWIALTSVLSLLKNKFVGINVALINRISGTIIVLIGILLVLGFNQT